MKTGFVIPLIDTNNRSFESELDLTLEQINQVVGTDFRNNYNLVNNKAKWTQYHEQCYYSRERYRSMLGERMDVKPDDKLEFAKTDANITDSNDEEVTIQYFDNLVRSGGKTSIWVSINPETVSDHLHAELMYWIDDSILVLNDDSLDKRTKILNLPPYDFIMDDGVSPHVYRLCNCRLLGMSENQNEPYTFILLVDKIMYY